MDNLRRMTFTEKDLRRERLKQLIRERFDNNQSAFSRAVGSSSNYVNRVLHGQKNLGEDLARKFEQALRLEPYWFDAKAEHPRIRVVATPDLSANGEHTLVPRRRVQFSAGSGSMVFEEEHAPPLAFRNEWLQRRGLDPSKLVVAYVKGDSMAPTLADGDTVLINTAERGIIDGKVYALRQGGELRIKRLFMRTFSVLVVSDNPAFTPEEIPLDKADDLHIIGQVVWSACNM
jgi:phage repressor protein C with HTH and peptisase S24 domain